MRAYRSRRMERAVGQLRTYCVTSSLLQSWAQQSYRPWMCKKTDCRKVNFARSQLCEGCGDEKPILTKWVCTQCSSENFKGVRFCKKCASPASASSGNWACACCLKNNPVDDLDDNSICGFCEYDMAPKTKSEADLLRMQEEISERIREQQHAHGSVESSDGNAHDNPWSDSTATPAATSSLPSGADQIKAKRHEFKPFVYSTTQPTAVSRLMRPKKPVVQVPNGPPGFDWMCRERHCGAMNKGDTNVCVQCRIQIVPAEWECGTCGAKNHWSRGLCFSCSTPITPSWLCSRCRTRTSIYDSGCRSCGSLRPPVDPVDPKDIWSGKHQRAKPKKSGGTDWVCEGCRAQNFQWRDRCFSCDMAKEPGSSSGAMWSDGSSTDGSPVVAVNDNNWICDSCHSSNFRTRTECWQCGKSAATAAVASDSEAVPVFAKEGFQKGLEDSPALGSSKSWNPNNSDWVCGKCFAKNFKNKSECHKCGTTKTVASVTRRIVVKKPVKL